MADYAPNESDIAIVGMAGRFPGAQDIATFWQNLKQGIESVTSLTDDQLSAAGVSKATLKNPNYVKSSAILDDMEMFDAGFFGMNPKEAAIMDPQHRHFLEVAWQALESACCDPTRVDSAIGVFAGSGHNAYLPYNLLSNPDLVESVGFFSLRHNGNDKDFLSTRVSYELDLKGPSISIQTACSTSLVATHVACQSLLNFECDIALAGAVTIELPHRVGYLHQESDITSSDGHCRPFCKNSNGTHFGSGAAALVLKRMDDAIANNDFIHAVIKGSAINNDGSDKVSYLAPSVDAQAAVISEALSVAEVDPDSIGYVEGHGTGTLMGDPIELAALTQAFRTKTQNIKYCAIGSVKGNIGHLDTAAGIAGLIKTVEALKNNQIPPSINFQDANPALNLEHSPFYVNTELRPWESEGEPRRAGVTSLGVGGTNAHIILEEAPAMEPSASSKQFHLIPLSARTPNALEHAGIELANHIEKNPEINLADLAFSLQHGRREFEHRRSIICESTTEAVKSLRDPNNSNSQYQIAQDRTSSITFMFAGGGAQFTTMGEQLYAQESIYRETVDLCLSALDDRLATLVRNYLFNSNDLTDETPTADSTKPSIVLPALFITQYAQAKLWISWDIKPDSFIGHSMGEYTAACLAGVFEMEDALSIVAERGRLFELLDDGTMLGVFTSEEHLLTLISDSTSIAAVNSPEHCVASGPKQEIAALVDVLIANDIDFQNIEIDVAAHSFMVEPILDRFSDFLKRIPFNKPQLPLVSNVTGTWAKPDEITTPDYWIKHLRQTVYFGEGIGLLLRQSSHILLEIGPGKTLSNLAKSHPDKQDDQLIINSMRHPKESSADLSVMYNVLGRLWTSGFTLNWDTLYAGERRQRLPLPTYPFERKRYWVEPGRALSSPHQQNDSGPQPFSNWFSQPIWKTSSKPTLTINNLPKVAAIFMDNMGFGEALSNSLERKGCDVIEIRKSDSISSTEKGFTLDPNSPEQYEQLIHLLDSRQVGHLLHLWNIDENLSSSENTIENSLSNSFFSLFYLGKALHEIDRTTNLTVISNNMQQIGEEPITTPCKSLLLGPCGVIPKELDHVSCSSIDVILPNHVRTRQDLVEDIISEICSGKSSISAYRMGQRLIPGFDTIQLPESTAPCTKTSGVYLITGGLGGIGFVLAKHLIKSVNARLVVFGRTELPDVENRERWINEHPADNYISIQLRKMQALEAIGGDVLNLPVNVADYNAVKNAIANSKDRFGSINGVFHTAGVISDGLVGVKTKAEIDSVFQPKVQGTLVLDKVLEHEQLDFFVLFSSTSVLLGLEGQIDYTAANSFLDAYARYKRHKDGTPTCSVNWGRWGNVGMGARISGNETLFESDIVIENSIFERYRETNNGTDYFVSLCPKEDWILSEHRTKSGTALLSGTSYLTLIHAALNSMGDKFQAIELADVQFLEPFYLDDESAKELVVSFESEADSQLHEISITSCESNSRSIEHTRGRVKPLKTAEKTYPIFSILERCKIITDFSGTAQHEHMIFGDRWRNVQTVSLGDGEAVVKMSLPKAYVKDLIIFPIHPALLDMATGKAQSLIPGFNAKQDFYIPISYGRLQFYKPLKQNIFSHIRINHSADTKSEFASFDITITDDNGVVLVLIEQFMMKRLDSGAFSRIEETSRNKTTQHLSSDSDESIDIQPIDGMRALDYILSYANYPQIIVSPLALDTLTKQSQSIDVDQEQTATIASHDRPDLSTAYVEPRNDIEASIAEIWQQALGLAPVGIKDSFFDLGGHSLLLTQTVSKIRKQLNVRLPLSKVFDQPNIAYWSSLIVTGKSSLPIANEQGIVTGAIPLTPALHRYLNERKSPNPHHWNISIMLQSTSPINSKALSESIEKLLSVHDALRFKFEIDENGIWTAFNNPESNASALTEIDLSELTPSEQSSKIEELSAAAQSKFSLNDGQLFSVSHFHMGNEAQDRILITVHHFVSDALSWTILLEDLQSIYDHRKNDKEYPVLVKSTSYKRWAEDMFAVAQSKSIQSTTDFWLHQPWPEIKPLPVDYHHDNGSNTNASAEVDIAELTTHETEELIRGMPSDLQIENVMLGALCRAIGTWAQSPYAHIDVMRHGREENEGIELSRTVGFFTSYVPLIATTRLDTTFSECLVSMAANINEMLIHGNEYDMLRFLSEDSTIKEEMSVLPLPEVLFNFIGHRNENNQSVIDQNNFKLAPESTGPTHSPRGTRHHSIAFKCGIVEHKLTYTIVYSKNIHKKGTIESVAKLLLQELRNLIVEKDHDPSSIELTRAAEKNQTL